MATLASLVVNLEANTANLVKGVDRVDKRFKRFGRSATNLKRVITGLISAVAVKRLADFTKQIVESADAIAKSAKTVGLSSDEFQALSFAMEQAGVEQSQFTSNMTAFIKRVGEARAGMGPLTSFLNKYDKSLLEAIKNTTSQREALDLIADAMQKAGNATDEAAIANAAFSRAGVGSVNALREGADALDEMTQKAREMGLVVDKDLIEKSEEVNDKFNILSRTIKAQTISAVARLSDEIIDLTEAISKLFLSASFGLPIFVKEFTGGLSTIEAKLSGFGANLNELQADVVSFFNKFAITDYAREQNQLLIEKSLRRAIELRLQEADAMQRVADLGDEIASLEQARLSNAISRVAPSLMGTLEDPLANIGQPSQPMIFGGQDGGRGGIAGQGEDPQSQIDEQVEREIELNERLTALHEEYQKRLTKIQQREAEKRRQAEEDLANATNTIRASAVNNAIGLFRTLGAEHKAFAIASVLIEKARAAQEILINFEIAKSKTAIVYAGNPAAEAAALARLEMMRNVSLGLIAATGVAEIAQINRSGGAERGTSANPVNVTDTTQRNLSRDSQQTFVRTDEDVMARGLTVNFNINAMDGQDVKRTVETNRGVFIDVVQSAYDEDGRTGGPKQ